MLVRAHAWVNRILSFIEKCSSAVFVGVYSFNVSFKDELRINYKICVVLKYFNTGKSK